MPQDIIRKVIDLPPGIDLRGSDLALPFGSARSLLNLDYEKTDEGVILTNRRGHQKLVNHVYDGTNLPFHGVVTCLGLGKHVVVDSDTGAETTTKFVIGQNCFIVMESNFSITWGGAGSRYVSVYSDGSQFRCLLANAAGTPDLNLALGTGLEADQSTVVTLEDLATQINLIANYTAVVGNGHSAYVQGNQVGTNTLACDDGAGGAHNLVIGDLVALQDAAGTIHIEKVTYATAGSIDFYGDPVNGYDFTDNDPVILNANRQPAAMLEQVFDLEIASGATVTLSFFELIPVRGVGNSSAFSDTATGRGSDGWVPPSTISTNNVLYISACRESLATAGALRKFDGQELYQAGLPQLTGTITPANAGAGNVDLGYHEWIVTLVFEDYQGNQIESIPSAYASLTVAGGAGQVVNITTSHTPLLGATGWTDGYQTNLNWGKVNGAQVGVNTINLSASYAGLQHLLFPGDKVCLYDGVSGSVVERNVTATTYIAGAGGTVTIDGAAVNVGGADPITKLLKIRFYRTKVGGKDYYFSFEMPVYLGAASSVYVDNVSDANLGAKFLWPEENEKHSPPARNARHLVLHQGSLCILGSSEEPNTVYPSVPGLPEYFPANLNFDIRDGTDGVIKGGGSAAEILVVGKDKSIHAVSGKILDAQTVLPGFRVDQIADGVGIASHQSVVQRSSSLLFLSNRGPMIFSPSSGVLPLATPDSDISSVFVENNDLLDADNSKLVLDYAYATYDDIEDKYMLFVPAHNTDSSGGTIWEHSANTNSKVFVFDFNEGRRGWRDWNALNWASGLIVVDGELWWAEWNDVYEAACICRRHLRSALYSSGTMYDSRRADHHQAISSLWQTGWGADDDLELDKTIGRVKLYSLQDDDPNFTLTVTSNRNFRNVAHTTYTETFSPTKKISVKRLRPAKSEALRLKFSHSILYEKVAIVGLARKITVPAQPQIGWVK